MSVTIPQNLLPEHRHFGSGPSQIEPSHIAALGHSTLLGTSHRQAPVKDLVGKIRRGLLDLLEVPDGYEVALGNGGSTAFWAVATACLVENRAAHGVFGEFGAKFAAETSRAPHLEPSLINNAQPGGCALPEPAAGVDVYAWPHHETSTGVRAPLQRPQAYGEALTVIDATSIAGAVAVDWSKVDVYYFAPQKCFAADGGIWFAILSPRAIERAQRLAGSTDRWIPDILNLNIALDNSRKNQTLNTPAIATLELLDSQLEWLNSLGISAVEQRVHASSKVLYDWAEKTAVATPFISQADLRSPVVVTIDFEGVAASQLALALRQNGIVDTEPYRKLGRNQLRIATFPTVNSADTTALTQCLDYLLGQGVGS